MALSVADATAFLQSRHVRVLDEWIVECLEWLQEQYQSNNVKPEELRQYVYEQWLDSDLSEIATPALPAGIAQQRKTILTGSYALQINSVQDVSVPAYGQLIKMQGKENENALVCVATQSNQPSQNKFETKSNRMLMLQLTDGHQFIEGMEYQPISHLSVDTVPGTKILVSGSVQCRLGVLMLTANNVRVLGGDVESLAGSNSKIHVLSRALGINESQEVGQEQRQIPSNDRQMTNGDPAPSADTNGANRHGGMTNHAQSHDLGTDEAAFRDEAEFLSDDLGDELDTLMLNEIEMIEEMDQIQRLEGNAEEETEWPPDEDDSIIGVLVEEAERTHGGGQATNIQDQTSNGAFQEHIPGQNPNSVRVERTPGVSDASNVRGQNANKGSVETTCGVGNASCVPKQNTTHGTIQEHNVPGQNTNKVHNERAHSVASNFPRPNTNRVDVDGSCSINQYSNEAHVERTRGVSNASNISGQDRSKVNVNNSHGFNQAGNSSGQNANGVHVDKPHGVGLVGNISAQIANRECVGKTEGVQQTIDVRKQGPNMEHNAPKRSMSSSSHTVTNFTNVSVKPIVFPSSKTTKPLSLARDFGTSSKPDSKVHVGDHRVLYTGVQASVVQGNGNVLRLNHKDPSNGFKAEPHRTKDFLSNADQGMKRTIGTSSESSDRKDPFHSQIENKFNVPSSEKSSIQLSKTPAIPDVKPKLPTTGSSAFSSNSTRQDAAFQKLKTGSSNPIQAVGIASRITRDLPSSEGGSLTTASSTSVSQDLPTIDRTVETLSAEESVNAAKRRRLHSGQGGFPLAVDSSSVVELSSVMSRIWAKEEFTFTIKGFVVTLLSSLKRNNGIWNISAKISDKTASLDVDLSNEVLTGLIGYSIPEMLQMRKTYRTKDATTAKEMETKLRQGLAQCKKSFIEMHCMMTISVKSDQERPLVTSIGKTDPADIATTFREVPKKY